MYVGKHGNIKKYQRRAAGCDEEVEDGEKHVILDHDQDNADGLQQPVDHVEPH